MSPALEADRSLTGRRVVLVLERAVAQYGLRARLQVDDGPEFAGQALDARAYRRGVQLCFSRHGHPTDNAYCEPFNGEFRGEFLNAH